MVWKEIIAGVHGLEGNYSWSAWFGRKKIA
jgi:hypothetical protein